MAFTRGRCTNFDYCSVAESRRDVEVRVGDEFVCPECGKPLKAPQIKGRNSSPVVPILLGLGVLVLVGGGVFLGMRLGGQGVGGQWFGIAGATGSGPGSANQAGAGGAQSAARSPGSGQGRFTGSVAVNPSVTAAPLVAASAPAASPVENVLARVHGAPAMGAQVVAPLAAAYLSEIGDTGVTTSSDGAVTRVSGMRGTQRESIVIEGDGVTAGFAALGGGRADLVMAPRRILAAEQTSLAALGDMTQPAAEHVLALDAQAIVVNPSNQVTSLTRAQIRDLFAGGFTDWASLGGPSGPVDIYAVRPQNARRGVEGTGGEEGQAAQSEIAPEAAPGARWVGDDAAISRAVVADLRGVGLVDLAAIGGARAVPVAETGAAPVSPTDRAAVAANGYPLANRLYLYGSPKAASGFAARFAAYALSAQGQAVVEAHGLVSPTLHAVAPAGSAEQAGVAAQGAAAGGAAQGGLAAPAAATGETGRLRAYVAGAKKLGIVFHFQPNSTELDQYGERDLDRVTNYLVSMHEGGDHLLLAGFADNQGDAASNVEVSRKRAASVAALFATRGLKPGGVEGFGAELPVADNGTEVGRERNRRVEVYIRR